MKAGKDYVELDSMMKELLGKMTAEELAAIPSDQEIDARYPVSKRFLKKMEDLISTQSRREEHDAKRKGFLFYCKRTAAAVLVAVLLFGGLLAVNEDARAAVQAFFLRLFDQYTSFQFKPDEKTELSESDIDITYITKGYQEQSSGRLGDKWTYRYVNQDEEIIEVMILTANSTVNFDTENMLKDSVLIDGRDAVLYTSEDPDKNNILVYTDEDQYMICISGREDSTELISIAEGLEIKK